MQYHYRAENLKLSIDTYDTKKELLQQLLPSQYSLFSSYRILRRSVDARRKEAIVLVYSLLLSSEKEISKKIQRRYHLSPWKPAVTERVPPLSNKTNQARPVIVGCGPAALFCALRLVEYGMQPVILERGKPVEERDRDILRLFGQGELDPESNIAFGEGGAGTYSDGKLTTQVNHPYNRFILETFTRFGAPEDILYDAKPHIGSDYLRLVVKKIREYLCSKGASILFSSRMDDVIIRNGSVQAVRYNHDQEIETSFLILAVGHSAHDTYALLASRGVAMTAKPFAVGLRIEHPQRLINDIQYGKRYRDHPVLGSASYKLTHRTGKNRNVYSFCMCPGGQVICSSNQPGRLVTNGMSNYNRASGYANAALVVSVTPDDFPSPEPLAGIAFIRSIEENAFKAGGLGYRAPVQRVTDYLTGCCKTAVEYCSYHPGYHTVNLRDIYPEFVGQAITEALYAFDLKMPGFISHDAVLVGVETRTSSPVRIARKANYEHLYIKGIFPIGEGAGYAGGIMSSALDGIKAADAIILGTSNNT